MISFYETNISHSLIRGFGYVLPIEQSPKSKAVITVWGNLGMMQEWVFPDITNYEAINPIITNETL